MNPVIIIFDNELSNNKKPLSKFVSHISLSATKKTSLQKDFFVKIIDEGNLYIATPQLFPPKIECELEDLFDEKTLGHTIREKTFSRNDNLDREHNYGKTRFAGYVQSNYKNIDFKNFRPLLDNIVTIIEKH